MGRSEFCCIVLLLVLSRTNGEDTHLICKQVEDMFTSESGIAAQISDLQSKIDALTAKVENSSGRISKLEASGSSSGSGSDISYRAILSTEQGIKFADAKKLCENIGWKLANIYGADDYQKIANLLRAKIQQGSAVTAWLGMTFDQETKGTFYTNGRLADLEGVKWYPSNPNDLPTHTHIGIHIEKDPSSTYQGIHTYPPEETRLGAVCEK